MRFPKSGLILLLLSCGFSLSWGEVEATKEIRTNYNAAVLYVEATGQDQIDDLYEKYAGGVQRLMESFQAQGDLENTIKARDELKLAQEKQKPGKEDFPEIARLREVLAAEEKKIREETAAKLEPLKAEFVEQLELVKIELTKAGNLVDAQAVLAEMDSLRAGASTSVTPPKVVVTEAKGTGPTPRLVDTRIHDIPVLPSGKMGGEVKLEPGAYRLREKLVGGDGGLPKESPLKKLTLTIPEGSSFEGESIYLDEGKVTVDGSRFRKMELTADLGGWWQAKRTLFDEVVFGKAGGWFSGYSAKFEFENCVIRKSHFRNCTKPNVGLQIRNSTFIDCELEPIQFKDDADAGREANDLWRTVENCLFVDCVIPQSFLYITKNCVFQNCRFGPYEQIPVKTRMQVTLYSDGGFVDTPSDRDENKFKVEDGSSQFASIGASIGYEVSAGQLNFR